ncbi:MAG: hypothetical protein AMJ56_17365 [Anaerolineae bacterium SG8_19]|jgi:hypothetical protein|nr:MAG: hypothetical protein AMJ56_17365 [Anaerolineae bacterium SG8_19]
MTTGLSYDGSVAGTTSYISQISTMAVVEPTNAEFLVVLPQMITYAENRIYRELDFLQVSTSITGYQLAASTRTVTIPAGSIVVSEQINLITPVGTEDPDAGTRVPLLPTTKEFLDAVYGARSYTGVPKYFAPFNDNLFYVGPFSDQTYFVEIVGTQRPASMSSSNQTTFISLYLPDLFIMASMIYISAYQRNFGRANDDPQMAVTYESQYQALLKGAAVEEARKKFESSGWTSQSPSPVATPTRG